MHYSSSDQSKKMHCSPLEISRFESLQQTPLSHKDTRQEEARLN